MTGLILLGRGEMESGGRETERRGLVARVEEQFKGNNSFTICSVKGRRKRVSSLILEHHDIFFFLPLNGFSW